MLGYFAFISLFEFIVLLIDPFIVKLTNGEPLKIWSIKIFLIAMLVPFQHFLEHGLIQFLSSRKLLELKQQFLIKRKLPDKEALATKAESATEVDDEMEEDTAVL